MGAKKTVLVADDERRWQLHVKTVLGDDYAVEVVKTGHAAVERVSQGGIDLVVIDHLMPGEEPYALGYDVCTYLRKKYPTLALILFTEAWIGVEPDRAKLEKETGAVVVFKDSRDPVLDDLLARVKELVG